MDMNRLCPQCMKEMRGERRGFCTNCGFDFRKMLNEVHQLQPFTMLQGRYIIGKVIQQGGSGIIYVGLDSMQNKKVVIQEFYPNGFVAREENGTAMVMPLAEKLQINFEAWRDRFLEQAGKLAGLGTCKGMTRVMDAFAENHTAYLVMEYEEGVTLEEYIRQAGGKLMPMQAVQMIEQILPALVRIHEAGLIHADINPDNILIDQNGMVSLRGLGAAGTAMANGSQSLTSLLKPGYAAQEQYRTGGDQGPWTDVYAVSAVLYRCVTGNLPIESSVRLSRDDLTMPRALGIPISENLEAVLKMGLAVLKEKRFKNMKAFQAALANEAKQPAARHAGANTNNQPIRQQPPIQPVQPSSIPAGQPQVQPPNIPAGQPQMQPVQPPNAQTGRPQMPPNGQQIPPQMGETVPKKKSNLPIYIFIIVAIMICVLGGIGIYWIAKQKITGISEREEISQTQISETELDQEEEETAVTLSDDASRSLEKADSMVQAAAKKVKDAATRGEGLTELQEAIKLYEEAGEEEAAFEAAQAGIDEALLSYVEGILLQSDMLMEQGTSIDLFDQIMMDIDDTLLYGQGIEVFGYTIDLSELENKKEAYAAEYRERFIEEFNGFIEEEQWNVRHNEEFMRGAYEKLATEDENDAIRLRYCYAYAWLVHQEVVEKMSSGEMDAEAAVLYIMDALEKTDYNEFLIQDAEAYASNAGGSWINQDYFKSVKSSQLIPDSDTVEYSVEDIMALGLNAAELRYARYEIYARHGMRTWDETANQRLSGVNNSNAAIAREKYMSYNDFGAYSTDDNNGLTEVERNNIRSIVQAELEQGMFIMEP